MAGLRVKYVPIGDVHPYEDNPRRNDGAVQAVAASIREFGWKAAQALTTKRRPGRNIRVG